jgi:hypothetical protein
MAIHSILVGPITITATTTLGFSVNITFIHRNDYTVDAFRVNLKLTGIHYYRILMCAEAFYGSLLLPRCSTNKTAIGISM